MTMHVIPVFTILGSPPGSSRGEAATFTLQQRQAFLLPPFEDPGGGKEINAGDT